MTQVLLRTLFVQTPGTRLVLDGDAVKAISDGEAPRRLPLLATDTIVVTSGVDVSNPLLIRCAEDGRLVAFLSRFGKPRAFVTGPWSGQGQLRRSQYTAHFDEFRRASMAASMVVGKIRQMQWGLRQWARDSDVKRATSLRSIADDVASIAERAEGADRAAAMGFEGQATKMYFRGMALALRGESFTNRNRRPPRDPVNAVLSFLYGMMRLAVDGAVQTVRLDPYCGFLHGDRDGQPSLVLDMLEEFRPSMDRLAVTLFNRKQLNADSFTESVAHGFSLTEAGRTTVLGALQEHRLRNISIQGFVEPVPNGALPIVQANLLANSLRTGRPYVPHQNRVQ